MPKVSIIVPVYNTEKYVDRCIESIINQELTSYELILVDDGSKDNSGKICDDWTNKDTRIITIHQQNQGVSCARNTGISAATGEYVCFVDSDDTVNSQWLQKVFLANENKNADVIAYGFAEYKGNSIVYVNAVKYFYAQNKKELEPFFYDFIKEKIGSSCDKLFKTKMLTDNNIMFDENVILNEDVLFNYKVLPFAQTFLNLSEALYNYEHHQGSSSQRGHTNILQTIINRVPKYKKFIIDMGYEVDENRVNAIIEEGVFLQYLQAVVSDNNLSYNDKTSILKKLYDSNEYRQILIKKIGEQPKSVSFLLGTISARLKMPFIVAVPSLILKLLKGK